ncbi:MAG: hypothetical protein ACK4M3_03500 [Pyrobaculum sp.]
MKQRVEQFFKKVREKIEAKSFVIEWRQREALAQIQLDDDFYVFVVFSWYDDECLVEYMIGDENAVVRPKYLERLDQAVAIVKLVNRLAGEEFTCLRTS